MRKHRTVCRIAAGNETGVVISRLISDAPLHLLLIIIIIIIMTMFMTGSSGLQSDYLHHTLGPEADLPS